ncbi:hypothetical protein NX781_00855 [Lactobacillus kullabergensis]|uniref:hypothetical protein n=1 Tax=Lactobacillus kullabergensis TaxID=1218493 RepID=UPI002247C837|nr:hypothetical protein [Lactobacillus kullabergensis]MCX0290364.1 hypothetical protein [Lactobacillus kullabergensis]
MSYLTIFLTIIYGVTMISASLLLITSLPIWLIMINVVLALGIIAGCILKIPLLTTIFLVALLLTALAIGFLSSTKLLGLTGLSD